MINYDDLPDGSKLKEEGRFDAVVDTAQTMLDDDGNEVPVIIFETKDKSAEGGAKPHPYVRLAFRVDRDGMEPKYITAEFYLTVATKDALGNNSHRLERELNERQITTFSEVFEWNGDVAELYSNPNLFEGKEVSIVVEEEQYESPTNGKTYYNHKVKWLNKRGGGMTRTRVTKEGAAEFIKRYGGASKSIARNAQNATKAKGLV